jgi:CDP-diacylglycerol---glycerol-3-phosphate 3-phosphatidyltransferase
MTPNQVTISRVGAGFAAVAIFTLAGDMLITDLAAVFLTMTAIALDGVDGYLARRRGMATALGAQLDILGDRIIENLFFIFFAVSGLISVWVPVVFFARGAVTDFLRGLAARQGRSGFGPRSMLETQWGRALVASRFSRAAYATLKCMCFCYLGILLPLLRLPTGTFAPWTSGLDQRCLLTIGQALTGVTLGFCVIRAVPVMWEGRRYMAASAEKSKSVVAMGVAR